jgi:hypothetical protein
MKSPAMKKVGKGLKMPPAADAVEEEEADLVNGGGANGGGGDVADSRQLPKTLSNFLQKSTCAAVKSTLKGTLRKKKEKGLSILNTVGKKSSWKFVVWHGNPQKTFRLVAS